MRVDLQFDITRNLWVFVKPNEDGTAKNESLKLLNPKNQQ